MSRVLVMVHGAGTPKEDYYRETTAAIAQLMGHDPPCVAVYYADITDPALASQESNSSGPSDPTHPTNAADFRQAFAGKAHAHLQNLPEQGRKELARLLPGLAKHLEIEIHEIAAYIFKPRVLEEIQKRMLAGLDEAARRGAQSVIVGHSLGAVVAFDALREHAAAYRTAKLVTLGSPLARLRELGKRSPDVGEITRAHVGEWLNLYDTTDPLCNPHGPAFPLPGYRLRDVFVSVAKRPPASHDYLHNPDVLEEIASALQD